MPTLNGYIRVSSDGQVQSGLSLDRQREVIRLEYEARWRPLGFAWGRIYEDHAELGGRPLRSRPAGLRLSNDLADKDVVVFPKLDRGFRNTGDLIATVEAWEKRGIRAVFLDLMVDTGTAAGRLHLEMMGAIASFERARISERTKDALIAVRARGVKLGAPGMMMRKVGPKGRKRLEVKPEMLELGRRVVEWKLKGFSYDAIRAHLATSQVFRPRTKGDPRRHLSPTKPWCIYSIRGLYIATLNTLRMIEAGEVKEPPPPKESKP